MSDTFDHMGDAFDQYVAMEESGECWNTPDNRTRRRKPDPLYYHDQYTFSKVKAKTEKAYLLQSKENELYWVPKTLCREMNEEEGTVWIWEGFEPDIIDKIT